MEMIVTCLSVSNATDMFVGFRSKNKCSKELNFRARRDNYHRPELTNLKILNPNGQESDFN